MYYDTPQRFLGAIWQGAYAHRNDPEYISGEYGITFSRDGDYLLASLSALALLYIKEQKEISYSAFKHYVMSSQLPDNTLYQPQGQYVAFYAPLG